MVLRAMFSRRWWWTTLLVVAAVGVMVRLGIWQLDRLEARRAFNSHVLAQQAAESLDLNKPETSVLDLPGMEYRAVVVRGTYDHTQEVALRNQAWGNQPGVHLITPLVIPETGEAVLVDRGWIPAEAYREQQWDDYAEPGLVTVLGVVRRSQERPDFGRRSDPEPGPGDFFKAWNLMNVGQMDVQTTYTLLPVYVQQIPDPGWNRLPYRTQLDLDLTEGPHLGYAGQWFLFATVLALGYPVYLRRQEASGQDQTGPLSEGSSKTVASSLR